MPISYNCTEEDKNFAACIAHLRLKIGTTHGSVSMGLARAFRLSGNIEDALELGAKRLAKVSAQMHT
jgi:hypothetical protein